MATLVVPNIHKISKEELLLGNITVIKKDCEGVEAEVHGLTGNDLVITIGGSMKTLTQAITEAGGGNVDLTTSTITTSNGEIVTMLEIADSLDDVQFTIADIQAKYDNL